MHPVLNTSSLFGNTWADPSLTNKCSAFVNNKIKVSKGSNQQLWDNMFGLHYISLTETCSDT